MYTNDRDAYRQVFFITWDKYKKNSVLEPVEKQLLEIILQHPEYHSFLENPSRQTEEFALEENPFFHMSLHLAILEQIRTNRPSGIVELYQQILSNYENNAHLVQHLLMQRLAEVIAQTQQTGKMVDEKVYLEKLKKLL